MIVTTICTAPMQCLCAVLVFSGDQWHHASAWCKVTSDRHLQVTCTPLSRLVVQYCTYWLHCNIACLARARFPLRGSVRTVCFLHQPLPTLDQWCTHETLVVEDR